MRQEGPTVAKDGAGKINQETARDPAHHSVINYYDVGKAVALVAMLVDHVGFIFYPQVLVLRLIGRIAMPIYALLHGFSFRHNHLILLTYGLGFALAVRLGFADSLPRFPLNILCSFYVAGWIFTYTEPWLKKYPLLLLLVFPLTSLFLNYMVAGWLEYGWFPYWFMVMGYMFRLHHTSPMELTPGMYVYMNFLMLWTGAIFCLDQTLGFNFQGWMVVVLIMEIYGIYVLGYVWNPYARLWSVPRWLATVIKWMSRYSLQLYCVHLLLFLWFKKWWGL